MTSYAIGYVYNLECAMSWHRQLMNLVDHDRSTRQRIVTNGILGRRCATDGLSQARNSLVCDFLATDAENLLWLDTDMGLSPTLADELLAVSDPVERPIVGALAFMQQELAPDGLGGYRTGPSVTIFDWVEEGEKRYLQNSVNKTGFPVNTLVECAATGSACVLIHRSVFEKIREEHGPVWYDRLVNPTTGVLQGEDLSFCIRADRPVYVHTGVHTSHLKQTWLQAWDYWERFRAPAAELECAVIVPVMNRPASAAPFMKSLRASTGLANVYAVADQPDHDTQIAWKEAGANVLISDRGFTFAQKANCGYQHTTEPTLFFVGDDVKFYAGWLDQAQHVMTRDNVGLVSTNDMGNAAVLAGAHATHPLVRRSYIDEQGGSWDGPGLMCHEKYGHWYVDNEWTWVARQRGQFGAALGSLVEHLHPIFGKGQDDNTYKRGQASRISDEKHWLERARKYAR